MASGVYAKVDVSSASTWTTVVAPPAAGVKVATVTLCNRTGSNLSVRLALAATTSVTDSDVIEYDTTIPANGVLERTGIGKNDKKCIRSCFEGVATASKEFEKVRIFG